MASAKNALTMLKGNRPRRPTDFQATRATDRFTLPVFQYGAWLITIAACLIAKAAETDTSDYKRIEALRAKETRIHWRAVKAHGVAAKQSEAVAAVPSPAQQQAAFARATHAMAAAVARRLCIMLEHAAYKDAPHVELDDAIKATEAFAHALDTQHLGAAHRRVLRPARHLLLQNKITMHQHVIRLAPAARNVDDPRGNAETQSLMNDHEAQRLNAQRMLEELPPSRFPGPRTMPAQNARARPTPRSALASIAADRVAHSSPPTGHREAMHETQQLQSAEGRKRVTFQPGLKPSIVD